MLGIFEQSSVSFSVGVGTSFALLRFDTSSRQPSQEYLIRLPLVRLEACRAEAQSPVPYGSGRSAKAGGGVGNRTRVRKHFIRASTCLVHVLIFIRGSSHGKDIDRIIPTDFYRLSKGRS